MPEKSTRVDGQWHLTRSVSLAQIATLIVLGVGLAGSWTAMSANSKYNSSEIAEVKSDLEKTKTDIEEKIDEQSEKLDEIHTKQEVQGERLKHTQRSLDKIIQKLEAMERRSAIDAP
jgi:peptidoglycan hydrolase CwlO-like protein